MFDSMTGGSLLASAIPIIGYRDVRRPTREGSPFKMHGEADPLVIRRYYSSRLKVTTQTKECLE